MSVKISGKVWELELDPMDKFVLLALADHADHDGENVRPGNDLLCAKTGLSHQTISAKIAKFTQAGILKPSKSLFGRGKKREFSIDPDSIQRHPYFIEKEEKKMQAKRTFLEQETCKQGAPLESERCNLTDRKVQADSGKVQADAIAYKEHEPSIEPSIESSVLPTAKPQAGKLPDPLFVLFSTAFLAKHGAPYIHKKADFIQLAELRKKSTATQWELSESRFTHALNNYLASELGEFTLADLSVRFSAFFRCALDRYNKPKEASNAKTNGSHIDHKAIVSRFKATRTLGVD